MAPQQPQTKRKFPNNKDGNKTASPPEKKLRKESDPAFPLVQQLKQHWESLRLKRLDKPTRRQMVRDAMAKIQGKYLDLIFKHDASRIVQSLIKYTDNKDRFGILDALMGHWVEIAMTPYGRFVVLKALKYAPNATYRSKIIGEFTQDRVGRKLIRHRYASTVVDTIYCIYANASERSLMIEAFYGMEYSLTKKSLVLMKKFPKVDLAVVLAQFPEKKDRIMTEFKDGLAGQVNKEGTLGQNELLHRLMFEYFSLLSLEELQAQVTSETGPFYALLKQLPEIVHTKFGSQVSMITLSICGAKERKTILKALKQHAVKLVSNEYGWTVAARILDCVDDTVLVKTSIWSDVVLNADNLSTLMRERSTQKLLVYLLAGKETRYFSPAQISQLSTSSSFLDVTSKKDAKIRRAEHVKVVLPKLVEALANKEVLRSVLGDVVSGHLLVEVLRNATAASDLNVQSIMAELKNLFSEEMTHPESAPDQSNPAPNDAESSSDEEDDEEEKEKEESTETLEINQEYVATAEQEEQHPHISLNPHTSRILKKLCTELNTETFSFRTHLESILTETDFVKRFVDDIMAASEPGMEYPTSPFFILGEVSNSGFDFSALLNNEQVTNKLQGNKGLAFLLKKSA